MHFMQMFHVRHVGSDLFFFRAANIDFHSTILDGGINIYSLKFFERQRVWDELHQPDHKSGGVHTWQLFHIVGALWFI